MLSHSATDIVNTERLCCGGVWIRTLSQQSLRLEIDKSNTWRVCWAAESKIAAPRIIQLNANEKGYARGKEEWGPWSCLLQLDNPLSTKQRNYRVLTCVYWRILEKAKDR